MTRYLRLVRFLTWLALEGAARKLRPSKGTTPTTTTWDRK